MQKSLLISLFFGIVLCSKVINKPVHVRHARDWLKTTTFDEILISVETLANDVEISEPKVSVILPGAFENCRYMTSLKLDLMKGPIRFAESSPKGLERLAGLEFGDSLVTLYDDTFKNMPDLLFIDMRLSEFTTEITNKFDTLQYLKELRIKKGNLGELKAYTFNNNNNTMRLLELSSCLIYFIEANAFAALIKLVTLDLSNNALMRIAPGAFNGLSELTILNLKNNNLYKIGETAFNGLVQLVTIDISYNNLIEIALETFRNLEIENFILNNNRLEKIERGLFNNRNSSSIIILSLHSNLINHIEDEAFAGLNIEKLNLAENKLGFIGNDMFKDCKSIRQLNLAGNPTTKYSFDPFKNCIIGKISFLTKDQDLLWMIFARKVTGRLSIHWT